MLLTALANNGLDRNKMPLTKAGTVFKTNGFKRHPVTVWTGLSSGNMEWHLDYLRGMLTEYIYRFNKEHSLSRIVQFVESNLDVVPKLDRTPFHNSSEFKDHEDVIEAYKKGMNVKWNRDVIKVKWTKREPPNWAEIPIKQSGDIYYRDMSSCPDLRQILTVEKMSHSSATDVPSIAQS
jgi:uncharacterized protein YbaA (DUF1428 family)